jgi:BON domain
MVHNGFLERMTLRKFVVRPIAGVRAMIETTWEPETCTSPFTFRSQSSSALSELSILPIDLESTNSQVLAEAVGRALASTGYLELRNLRVNVIDDLAKLVGQVPSYYLKQLAQSAVKRVPGVARVVNAVEVIKGR